MTNAISSTCKSGPSFKMNPASIKTINKLNPTLVTLANNHIEAKRNVYTRDYELLPYRVGRDPFDPRLAPKPDNYYEMLKVAENLSKPFPFVRVDLYNVDSTIIFGELTFFHAGECNVIEPYEFQYALGEAIKLQ